MPMREMLKTKPTYIRLTGAVSLLLSLASCQADEMMPGGGMGGTGGTGAPPPTTAPPESAIEERLGLVIFDDTRIHTVNLFMTEEDWKSILDDSRGDEPRRATVTIDGVTITNAGVRPSGESSRVPGNTKMSMRIDFDAFEKKKLGGFDTIKVSGSWDDPFVARDRLAYWCYRQFLPSPREVPGQLYVNGQPRGVYEIEEVWGKESLKPRFADASGTLYRIRGLAGMDPYAYRGPDPALYVPLPWDAKGNHVTEEHLVIGKALEALNATPTRLEEAFDVENVLTYFALSALLSNTDGFLSGFEVDDHYQYHDPTTGRFVMLPWDADNTFGSINDLPTRDMFEFYDRSILTKLIRDTPLRDRFFAKVEDVMQRLPAAAIQAQADLIANQIREGVKADKWKMYPTDHFEWSIGYIKDFIAARYAALDQQMTTLGSYNATTMAAR